MAALSEMAESQSQSQGRGGVVAGSRAGSRKVSAASSVVGGEGVHRKPSNTKGFL
jgi:hypothetical protein